MLDREKVWVGVIVGGLGVTGIIITIWLFTWSSICTGYIPCVSLVSPIPLTLIFFCCISIVYGVSLVKSGLMGRQPLQLP